MKLLPLMMQKMIDHKRLDNLNENLNQCHFKVTPFVIT